MNSTRVHFNISAREIGANDSACPPFWILPVEWFWWRHRFQIASFSPSTLENSVFKKHRFQIAPLWRAFPNGSVFGDPEQNSSVFVWKRISVDRDRFSLKMFVSIVRNSSFQFTLPNLSFRHIDDAPVDRWPIEFEKLWRLLPWRVWTLKLQNAGPESRQLRVTACLARQWIKEGGIICITFSLGFIYLAARLAR